MKQTVAIGIPAYNAEYRIEDLVHSLLNQVEGDFKIVKVLIHCDDCSDATVEVCEALKLKGGNGKIEIIDNKSRLGFALSSLKMMESTKEDIFVLLNDDIKIEDTHFIEKLIQPILNNPSVGLTSGYLLPVKPRTFIEKAVVSTFRAYDRMRRMMNDKNNQYTYDGASMALTRKYINSIKLPEPISDLGNMDAYLYFSCISSGFKYIFADKAVLYHRYPATFIDYKKQIIRNNAQLGMMKRQFKNIDSELYKKPVLLFLYSAFIEFVKNPAGSVFIVSMRLYILYMARKMDPSLSLVWDVVDSSKEKI